MLFALLLRTRTVELAVLGSLYETHFFQLNCELPESVVRLLPADRHQILRPNKKHINNNKKKRPNKHDHSWGSSDIANALLDYEFRFSDLPLEGNDDGAKDAAAVSGVYLPVGVEEDEGPYQTKDLKVTFSSSVSGQTIL